MSEADAAAIQAALNEEVKDDEGTSEAAVEPKGKPISGLVN